MTVPALRIDDLHVSYGRAAALHGVTLEVRPGQAVALLGANGAGKTTTIRAASGLTSQYHSKVTRGSIQIDGVDTTRLPSHRVALLRVAHVPEGRLIFAGMTVRENLQLGTTSRRRSGAEDTMALVLEMFPVLNRRIDHAGGFLSGGEQQMLAISRALMADPRMLLLDEVSLGLAPMITAEIFESLATIRRELGVSMLVVEQSAKLALSHCDVAFVLENGTVSHQGRATDLLGDPTIQNLYLGGDPDLPGTRRIRARRTVQEHR